MAQGAATPVREVIWSSDAREAAALAATVLPGTSSFAPVRTPLLASGFSNRAFARLGERLADFDMVPVQAGGAMPLEVQDAPALEPGSAFGVQLARGDVSLTSIGTVTYVEDERFVGFGHSLMDRGNVDYVTTTAYIHHVGALDRLSVLSRVRRGAGRAPWLKTAARASPDGSGTPAHDSRHRVSARPGPRRGRYDQV